MEVKLETFLKDLERLGKNSEKDYDSSKYFSYNLYLEQYNQILISLQKMGHFADVPLILEVPPNQRSRAGSPKEIEKHQEINLKVSQIYNRLLEIIGPSEDIDVIKSIENIFNRFHKIARQLRSRHGNRGTLDVGDEYDVQDLLRALLHLYFDDIRPEEWTPSYAGGSRRVDFLLKKERVVIEVKKTRRGLADKEIGEELLIDISTYEVHPDCDYLVCFVYDPEGRIGNPAGIESDLMKKSSEKLKVGVYIFPK
ncbi:hypothetical protein [Brevibacillus dissolubilis]|uniref:PD-(D/E)XK nuclease domain-containing protein n=1 Tax=Brevibacillus dissolubilis TaxID=1844116 RepID=UPI00159B86BE|nr:hypothetical protein [Brevibacillus dissolubilis]